MPGHPDGQNYPLWQGTPASQGFFNVVNGTPVIVQWQTVNFNASYILVGPLTAGVSVALAYFADAARTQMIILKAYVIRGGQSLTMITPALGPYAQLNVNTSQAGTISTQIVVVPVNTPVTADTYPDSGNLIANPTVALVASQVDDVFFPFVAEGEGSVMVIPSDALGKLNFAINEVNESGVIDGIAWQAIGPAAQVGPVLFKTGRKQCKLTITNTDAGGPHGCSYYAALIGKT
jgi:hypothetical protein